MYEMFFTILMIKEVEVKQYHWLSIKLKKSKNGLMLRAG